MLLRKLRNFVGFGTTRRSMRREEPEQHRPVAGHLLSQRRDRAVRNVENFEVDDLICRLQQRQILGGSSLSGAQFGDSLHGCVTGSSNRLAPTTARREPDSESTRCHPRAPKGAVQYGSRHSHVFKCATLSDHVVPLCSFSLSS